MKFSRNCKTLAVLAVWICLVSGLLVEGVRAGGGMTGGATEMTQIANNAELAAVRP